MLLQDGVIMDVHQVMNEKTIMKAMLIFFFFLKDTFIMVEEIENMESH